MEADILKSRKDIYPVQKYGAQYFATVLFINLFYFVYTAIKFSLNINYILIYFISSIGITACSIIMDVALAIETAE